MYIAGTGSRSRWQVPFRERDDVRRPPTSCGNLRVVIGVTLHRLVALVVVGIGLHCAGAVIVVRAKRTIFGRSDVLRMPAGCPLRSHRSRREPSSSAAKAVSRSVPLLSGTFAAASSTLPIHCERLFTEHSASSCLIAVIHSSTAVYTHPAFDPFRKLIFHFVPPLFQIAIAKRTTEPALMRQLEKFEGLRLA